MNTAFFSHFEASIKEVNLKSILIKQLLCELFSSHHCDNGFFTSIMMIFLGLKKWKASIKHTLIYVFEPSYKFCALVIDVVYQVASQNKAISQPNCSPWKIPWDKSVDRLFTGDISGNHTTHSFSVRGLILAREIGIYSSCIGSTKKTPKKHKPKTTHRTKKFCCSAFLLVCHVSCQQPCLEDLTPRC